MSIELLRGDSLSADRAEQVYLLTGQASTVAAKALLLSTAPSTFNSLPRLTRQFVVREEESESGDYIGTAVYGTGGGSNADLVVGDTRILINAIGGTTHITQSDGTEHSYPDSAPNFAGAIGVDSGGSREGADVFTGGLDFTIVKIVNSSDLTVSYLAKLLALNSPNPHTNDDTFSHTDTDGRSVQLAEGEALFMGFTNAPRGNGEDELRFQFKGSKNLADALPETGWTIEKEGWEHLWLKYDPEVDGDANALIHTATAAYVERVYPEGDFEDLGL